MCYSVFARAKHSRLGQFRSPLSAREPCNFKTYATRPECCLLFFPQQYRKSRRMSLAPPD